MVSSGEVWPSLLRLIGALDDSAAELPTSSRIGTLVEPDGYLVGDPSMDEVSDDSDAIVYVGTEMGVRGSVLRQHIPDSRSWLLPYDMM